MQQPAVVQFNFKTYQCRVGLRATLFFGRPQSFDLLMVRSLLTMTLSIVERVRMVRLSNQSD
jgi:hypothetical protein